MNLCTVILVSYVRVRVCLRVFFTLNRSFVLSGMVTDTLAFANPRAVPRAERKVLPVGIQHTHSLPVLMLRPRGGATSVVATYATEMIHGEQVYKGDKRLQGHVKFVDTITATRTSHHARYIAVQKKEDTK